MHTADPIWTPLAATAAAWLATYLVHSTVLLGGAWLLARRLAGHRLAVEEAAWKLALVGGLMTATLQVGLGVRPLGGAWTLTAGSDGAPPAAALAPAGGDDRAARLDPATAWAQPAAAAPTVEPRRAAGTATAAPARTTPDDRFGGGRTRAAAVLGAIALLAFAGGLLALAPLALAHLRLARRLRGRAPLDASPLVRFLRRLERAAGRARPARLTSTPRLATPIARGVARGEICLPARALRELAPAEQEGVVAHELAHLARRDPLWRLAAGVLERLLFIQPLNRLARRRLVEIAEYRCDDWAAGHTGRPLDLARCLTEVAGWSLRGAAPLPVPGIAAGSSLARRVRRLLERPAVAERAPRWLAPAGAVALAAVALAAPGISRGAAPDATGLALFAGGDEGPIAAVAPAAPRPAPAPVVAPAVAPAVHPVVRLAASDEPGTTGADRSSGDPGDDAAEMIEEEVERGFDAYGDEIERALAPLEDLDEQLAPLEEELDRHLDTLGEDFEAQMEALGEQMEALGEQMAALRAERGGRFSGGEAAAPGFDPIGPELEAAMERLGDEMSVLGEQLGALVEQRLGTDFQRRIDELVKVAVPSPEALDRIRTETERLAAEARSLADRHRLTEAELERLRLEARAVADLARPDAAKLEALREQVKKLAEEARPSEAELEALRRELEAKLPEIRARQREVVERQREALDRQREALEKQREALDRQREERRREPPPAEPPPTPPN